MRTNSESKINPKTIEAVFYAQKNTSIKWRNSSTEERLTRLKKILEWIRSNQTEIRNALVKDFNKPVPEIDLTEIYPVTAEIHHAIKNLKEWMKPRSVSTPISMLGTSGKIYHEPKGTSLIIAPWNYPFNLSIGPLVSAIAAGCTVCIKPSELTPHTSELIASMTSVLFQEDEVFTVQGDVEASELLLGLPFEHIFFTGSPNVGRIVMKAASVNLASVTLELGGKCPAIVGADADLKDAAEKLVWGKFVNLGQTCIAPDYILLHQSCRDTFIMELKVALQKMYDPDYKGMENSSDLARIINEKHFDRLKSYLEDAYAKGAELIFGGNMDKEVLYLEPTILAGLSDGMKVMQEEIFGPILPIKTYDQLDEAIGYVNGKPKPLALYYFGVEKDAIARVLTNTSSGNAVINDCILHYMHIELPFGGVNTSGIGKSHGHHGFLAFSNEKGVLKQRVGYNNVTLLRPPYGMKAKQLIKSLIKWF